jgi:hypothetical protein
VVTLAVRAEVRAVRVSRRKLKRKVCINRCSNLSGPASTPTRTSWGQNRNEQPEGLSLSLAQASLPHGRSTPWPCIGAAHRDRASLVHRAARTAGPDQAAGAQ